jgi:hypothetical protein
MLSIRRAATCSIERAVDSSGAVALQGTREVKVNKPALHASLGAGVGSCVIERGLLFWPA